LPVCLEFYKEYDDIKIARKVEAKLKRMKSKKIIERIIKDKEIKLTV
jgi:predicted GIY-YIG superfamily endonuclease